MFIWKPQVRMFAADCSGSGGALDKKKFREEGRRASWSYLEEGANPYPANSVEHVQWAEGFLDGLCESI